MINHIRRQDYEIVRTVKEQFDGETKEFDIYKVPISELHYNMQNGRIGTYIKRYQFESGSNLIELLKIDKEKYNEKIKKYIKESDKSSFKTTKEDIRKKTQLQNGVILTDGTIIDGNRRFTALCELYDETNDDKFGYFETIILDTPDTERKWKSIKRLEIQLQHGKDKKVDYSPIQKLVDIYNNTMVKNALLTENEYIESANLKKSDFNNLKQNVEIMVDFCDYFNIPEQFHIIDEQKLDGPFNEIRMIKNNYAKENLSDKYEMIVKPSLYSVLLSTSEGDRTRNIRSFNKVDKFKFLDEFKETNDKFIESIYNTMNDNFIDGEERIKKIKNDENTAKMLKNYLYTVHESTLESKKNESVERATKAKSELQKIKKVEMKYITEPNRSEMLNHLEEIKEITLELIKNINENEK